MTAKSLKTLTIVFSDPAWTIGTQQTEFATLNASVAAPPVNTISIQTLSVSASTPGQDTVGLLYTPDLDPNDPCFDASRFYVPFNVTRQGSLPNEDYNLIAIAPWISSTCTLAYMQAAQSDPCNGFLLYDPNDTTSDLPPGPDDPKWDLGDDGLYKSRNKYPIYVIDGQSGSRLMQQSAQYSGNMTGVPHGSVLATAYDPRDYVRLYVDISVAFNNSLPSLWVFLLIVLGILIGTIAAIFMSIHCLQRSRRQSLRRRIISGEVDLEALGIQRLIVPQNLLDQMPIFEYGTGKLCNEAQQTFSDEKGKDRSWYDSYARTTAQYKGLISSL
ncbi:hypothetical protein AMS68_002565 [Peltaster fructicola]|uniref:Uncharacterized protein n=1 Tax=Peltaster fructicola TaxID=286661 RepID=A0A6H0XQY1_9PEZI|nr:hypothetical protein AMS68_002565 [Peltaster fructicola]